MQQKEKSKKNAIERKRRRENNEAERYRMKKER